jgi:hypothetical protein
MKRSNNQARLLRQHGNRASLQRQSRARLVLVRTPIENTPPPQETVQEQPSDLTVQPTKRWRRRLDTY